MTSFYVEMALIYHFISKVFLVNCFWQDPWTTKLFYSVSILYCTYFKMLTCKILIKTSSSQPMYARSVQVVQQKRILRRLFDGFFNAFRHKVIRQIKKNTLNDTTKEKVENHWSWHPATSNVSMLFSETTQLDETSFDNDNGTVFYDFCL